MTASKGIFQRKIDVAADASDKVDTRALVDLVLYIIKFQWWM